jgi:PhnB protein
VTRSEDAKKAGAKAGAPPPAVAASRTGVKPIPEGHPRLSPYLISRDAGRVIEFLRRVLGATESFRLSHPDGRVAHAEVRIGDSVVMVSDGGPEHPPMPAMLMTYVEDVDATYAKALEQGATTVRAPADQFYGDRSGGVKDHAGNQWWFASRVENLTTGEIERRAASAMGG